MNAIIITGTCVCGHSWEDHHLGMIMNAELWAWLQATYPNHPPYVPQECEAYGSNEAGGLDPEGNDHCHFYKEI
jgi:hypothetical protein